MPLGCGRTQIKAPLLSLYNNMSVPAVPFLWGLCVCAAGGSEVGPGEGPGTLGSNGGFGGRHCVLMGLKGWVMGMVQPMSRVLQPPGPISGASQSPQGGRSGDRGAGAVGLCCPWGDPSSCLFSWPGRKRQERCCGISLSTSQVPIVPSGDPRLAPLALSVQRTWVLSH